MVDLAKKGNLQWPNLTRLKTLLTKYYATDGQSEASMQLREGHEFEVLLQVLRANPLPHALSFSEMKKLTEKLGIPILMLHPLLAKETGQDCLLLDLNNFVTPDNEPPGEARPSSSAMAPGAGSSSSSIPIAPTPELCRWRSGATSFSGPPR